MSSFRNYRRAVEAASRCCTSGRCAVCRSGPAQLCHEFAGMVRRSWSQAEIDILTKAAHSALL